MVPPQRYESKQEEIKSRESTRSKSRTVSTRSKSHEYMRSDRTTLRGLTLGQVNSKSFLVPHHRRSEGAATQLRPRRTWPSYPSYLAVVPVVASYLAVVPGRRTRRTWPSYLAYLLYLSEIGALCQKQVLSVKYFETYTFQCFY